MVIRWLCTFIRHLQKLGVSWLIIIYLFRCLVPECEGNNSDIYERPWLKAALPFEIGKTTNRCLRYESKPNIHSGNCTKDSFTNKIETCERLVFQTDENTITKEVSKDFILM